MTVENAHSFLDELRANGPNAKLMSKIGTEFQPEHMQEALKTKGINHDELLKEASGGSSASDWSNASFPAATAEAAAAT